MRQTWPAPERNKQPIFEVLKRVLPAAGRVLEISSGSGQHAVHFATHLPSLHFIPSDMDEANLESIRAWVEHEHLTNLAAPLRIDVCDSDWAIERMDAVFNANMIHIAPWACAEGLVRGVGKYLQPEGVFALYGPFRIGGAHTAPSNAAFDADLKRRNEAWGVRDLEAVAALGENEGLTLSERVAMPANNYMLIFRKRA